MTFQVMHMPARTLAWWRDERDDIELDPIYQRKGHVWSPSQQQYLIDSILNGFDIPKLYVADFTFLNSELNANRKKYAVIDGKQRLIAIYDFFNDKITLPKGFVYREDPDLNLGGYSFSDLQKNYPRISRKFENSNLTVMSVITDDESQINELFVRLNSSKPLTGAEVRNAMGGRLPALINELVGHPFFTGRIKFGTIRSQDKNTAAKLLLLEHRGSIVDTKKRQLDALASEGNDADAADSVSVEITDALVEVMEDTEGGNLEGSSKRVLKILDKLNGVFISGDPLLRQSAQVVMIYWLARNLDDSQFDKLRPFLLKFEADREAAKKKTDPLDPDQAELADYELMARTSNDAYSIKRRDQILQARFRKFMAGL